MRERIEALEAKVALLECELATLRNSIAVVPIHVQPVVYPTMTPYPHPWHGIIPPSPYEIYGPGGGVKGGDQTPGFVTGGNGRN